MSNTLDFDVRQAALEGKNLIEASAGTGKTYSIAVLVLRLIVERSMPLTELLMVTFTKAAVAELQDRVRAFVRLARDYARGEQIADGVIADIVMRATARNGIETVAQNLEAAVLTLDELSVYTIHGFCQRTLQEFAIETGQSFGATMFTEIEEVVEQELNVYWRKHIATLPTDILELLGFPTLKADMKRRVMEQVNGRQYDGYDGAKDYSALWPTRERYQELCANEQASANEKMGELQDAFYRYQTEIAETCHKSRARDKRSYCDRLDDPAAFIDLLREGKENALTKALPEGFRKTYMETLAFMEQAGERVELGFRQGVYGHAIGEVTRALDYFMRSNNLLGYNDLIGNLAAALLRQDNVALISALRRKYKAVFVDEFQDTDADQYAIFSRAFGEDTLLFLIGDPKQSIYAWRKADIDTYFKARREVDRVYHMNTNYRSSKAMIDAMNAFFLPFPGFDTFYFKGADDAIRYTHVEAPDGKSGRVLLKDGCPTVTLETIGARNKEEIQKDVCGEIMALLAGGGYEIGTADERRAVRPSDIGILVRKNQEGLALKKILAEHGVPAVIVQDEKILKTEEALDMLYVLEAVLDPEPRYIHKALLSHVMGWEVGALLQMDEVKVLAAFQEYRTIWNDDGIYPALVRLVDDWAIRERLLSKGTEHGIRALANVYQLIELLNQVQQRKEHGPDELLAWLRQGIAGKLLQGDEYQLRIESDEDAVKIVTVHKSKGLEYPIVFAPFLDMRPDDRQGLVFFRNPESGAYEAKERLMLDEKERAWHDAQQEQENRRLIYVAVTRAVYKCYVYRNGASYYKNSSLAPFVPNVDRQALLGERETSGNATSGRAGGLWAADREADNFVLMRPNWGKLSYTRLSLHAARHPKERGNAFDNEYDAFVFQKLKAGAMTGNLLHQLLEEVDYSDSRQWDQHIDKSLSEYMPLAGPVYRPLIRQMLDHVTSATIEWGGEAFSLKEITKGRRLAELEFDFPVEGFRTAELRSWNDADQHVMARAFDGAVLEGMMNGKVDLIFERGGKYYILDWKSNYLGHGLQDYALEGVARAMNENNYHLQYLIYTLALKKYLQARIPGFSYEEHFGGVVYVFLRGARKGKGTGMFVTRPSLASIEALEGVLCLKS